MRSAMSCSRKPHIRNSIVFIWHRHHHKWTFCAQFSIQDHRFSPQLPCRSHRCVPFTVNLSSVSYFWIDGKLFFSRRPHKSPSNRGQHSAGRSREMGEVTKARQLTHVNTCPQEFIVTRRILSGENASRRSRTVVITIPRCNSMN